MGEAEDVVLGRIQQTQQQAEAEYAAESVRLMREVESLIPSALANLRRHNYSIRCIDVTVLTIDGIQRVGWLVANATWSSYDPKCFLLGDGTFASTDVASAPRINTIEELGIANCKKAIEALRKIVADPGR